MLKAFAQSGQSSHGEETDRQTVLCLSSCCGQSNSRDPLGCSGDNCESWEIYGPGVGLSGTQPWGGPGPLPSPGIQLFRPGQEFRPFWTVHMVTMGPILRTLENTAPAEKGRILVGHKGPQCHNLDQGTNGGKEHIHAPSVCLP